MKISEKISILDSEEVELTSSQLFTSQLIQSFCEQATSSSLLSGMVCGNFLGSITKSYVTRFFSPIFQKNGSLVRGLSTVSGCFMEGTGIQLVPLLLKGEGIGEEGFRGWIHMGLTMTMMKGIGCAQISNPFVQHAVQDLAMVQFDRICGAVGFIQSPPTSFVEAMMQAEVISWQMSIGCKLLDNVAPSLRLLQAREELQVDLSSSPHLSFSSLKKGWVKLSGSFEFSPHLTAVNESGLQARIPIEKNRELIQKAPILLMVSQDVSRGERRSVPLRQKELVNPPSLYELAKREAAAKNVLLTSEYISYLLAWQRVVNPELQRMRMIYNAGGPDRSTPSFLVGRGGESFVIDLAYVSAKKLKFYLENWELIDQTPLLPFPSSWSESGWATLSNYGKFKLKEHFLRQIHHRAKKGYWHISMIEKWGMERCIVIELKKMGVDPGTILPPIQKSKYVELQYQWGMEGERAEEMNVVYLEGSFPELMDQGRLPMVDFYYQKAVSSNMDAVTIPEVPKFIRQGGTVLLGRTNKSLARQKITECENRLSLGSDFETIDVPWHYTLTMHELIERYSEEGIFPDEEASLQSDKETEIERSNYWWQLYGARKVR